MSKLTHFNMDTDHGLYNDIVISTQTEFDSVFTGTIPENTSIFIKKKATPYLLNSGQFNNEGTVDNIASCSYIGHFGYTNNAGTITYVHTTALTTTDLH